jgi:hypothetical protein
MGIQEFDQTYNNPSSFPSRSWLANMQVDALYGIRKARVVQLRLTRMRMPTTILETSATKQQLYRVQSSQLAHSCNDFSYCISHSILRPRIMSHDPLYSAREGRPRTGEVLAFPIKETYKHAEGVFFAAVKDLLHCYSYKFRSRS